jgi:glutaconyl-CoA/methylmalonyl-CoA decarboxylase subunit gamma
MDLIAGKQDQRLRIEPAKGGYQITIGDRQYVVDVARVRDGFYSLRLDGAQHEVAVARRPDGTYWVSDPHGAVAVPVADPLAHLAAQGGTAKGGRRRQRVTAYMPGRVVALLVAEGQAVEAGQGVLVLEAMKMQNEIQAEHAGTVTRILVQTGQPVDGGDPLFELE